MAENGAESGGLIEKNEAGIFADHPPSLVLPVFVAPTDTDKPERRNTIRQDVIVVACGHIHPGNFAFDSSVIGPQGRLAFAALHRRLERHPGCPLSIFGHADPVGNDTYNKFLSERRARAVFAVLRRRVDLWEKLHNSQEGASGDVWGLRSVQIMLQGLGFEPGNVDGDNDPQTRSAIRAFVEGLPPTPGVPPTAPATGVNDAPTRKKLFAAYMDFLCVTDAGPAGKPYELPAERFLAGGEGSRGDVQGCSEFNPQRLMSRQDEATFKKEGKAGEEARNAANADNRRVLIFVFKKGTKFNSKKWPCPTAAQGIEGCKKRFWSNGENRRTKQFDEHARVFGRRVPLEKAALTPPNPTLAAELAEPETTFGCRFYHGLALGSPCEGDMKAWLLRLMVDQPTRPGPGGKPEREQIPIAGVRFAATIGESADSPVLRGRVPQNGILFLPLFDPDVTMQLKLDGAEALGLNAPLKKDEETKEGEPGAPAGDAKPAPVKDAGGEKKELAAGPEVPDQVEVDDSKPFPDEDKFLSMTLRGGALKRMRSNLEDDPESPPPGDEERRIGARQRLYNLGYGPADPETWTDDVFVPTLARFQKDQKLKTQDGTLDEDTVTALIGRHGS